MRVVLLLLVWTTIAAATWKQRRYTNLVTLDPGWDVKQLLKETERSNSKVPPPKPLAANTLNNPTIIIHTTTTTTPTTTTTTPTTTPTSTASTTLLTIIIPTTTTTTTTSTTTTTTPTPTTTTSTTTTTTPTPTTTTPTPTTTTPTPTTTTSTTCETTPPPPACDKFVDLVRGTSVIWSTPNYPNNYPEDITCKLTIKIAGNRPVRTMALISVMGYGYIFRTPYCTGDYLKNFGGRYCGSLTRRRWAFRKNTIGGPDIVRQFIFRSTSDDGGTAMGFKIYIRGL